jgi:L-2-hydroxyglutarate oxidase LhgO
VDVVQTVVVGAGVVGLAVARALARQGQEVLVLESAETFGTGTSARNSEVIHAGIYYPAGSLKAQLCVRGRQLLYAYAAERAVAHRRCGKLIVATTAEQCQVLQQIQQKAQHNGVALQRLSRDEALALEPALACEGALLSPETGIVDSHGLMLALLADLETAGGLLAVQSGVAAITPSTDASGPLLVLRCHDGTELAARQVVNSAGLHAVALAHTVGHAPGLLPTAFYARGHYFTLSARAPFSRLIYPVPEAAGLGIHLTLDLGGQARFGPDVQWVDDPHDLQVPPERAPLFEAEVRRYWPGLPEGALQPAYAGMRPKISGPGAPAADFAVLGPAQHGVPGLVHLLGIESPGLTSSLALAEWVQAQLGAPAA